MSRFEQQFDELPEDLQKIVCSKIVYTQPKKLLSDIKNRYIYNDIIKKFTNKRVNPTLNNMISVLAENLSITQFLQLTTFLEKLLRNNLENYSVLTYSPSVDIKQLIKK